MDLDGRVHSDGIRRLHRVGRFLTIASLAALIVGFLLGGLAHDIQSPLLIRLGSLLSPAGTLWVNAIWMLVLPLIVSHLMVAIAGNHGVGAVGRMGALSLVLFLSLLGLAGAYTVLVGTSLLRSIPLEPGAVESLRAAATGIAFDTPSSAVPRASFADWLVDLVPRNPFRAAVEGDILPVVVCTVLFALALTRVGAESRERLVSFFRAIAEMTLVLVSWVLIVLPVAVFALAYTAALETGFAIAGAVGYFIVLISLLLLAFTFVLYPIAVGFGRVGLGRFARGVAPAQIVAVGSRSSLASLPALMDGGRRLLGLPGHVVAFVLPLSVSTFKLNRTISSPFRLLFLAYIYGVPIEPAYLVTFVFTVTLLSFSSPGIPSGGFLVTLPFYVAAGIPVEGVVLLRAVDAIPDIFKTLVNVTGNMTVATIVARWTPGVAEPAAEVVPEAPVAVAAGAGGTGPSASR